MQQKAVLITGGAGYIGSHTAWLLAQKGYQVIILDTLLHKQTGHFPWATLLIDDFANEQVLDTLFSTHTIHAVMHFAAFIQVSASIKDPRLFYENNVTKTLTLLTSMLKHGVKQFIFSSSCAVYGQPTYIPIDEKHPKQPISPYGMSKHVVETILEDFHQAYDLQYVSLRYFNAAGALAEHNLGEQHQPETHIIPLLLQAIQQRRPFSIFGADYQTADGTCIRDFLHVIDIAQAHLLALQHLEHKKPSDCFNLGTGHGISVKELVAAAQKLFETPIKTVLEKQRAGDPATLIADPSKAQNILDWKPEHSHIEEILRSAFDYMLKQQIHVELLQAQV